MRANFDSADLMERVIALPEPTRETSHQRIPGTKNPAAVKVSSLTIARREALRGNILEMAAWLAIAASSLAALVASAWP